MTDWIKRRAAELHARDADKEGRRQWQLHKKAELAARGPAQWAAIKQILLEQAKTFNKEIGDPDRTIDSIMDGDAISVHLGRSARPAIEVDVVFCVETRQIEIAITRPAVSVIPEPQRSIVELDLTDSGDVVLLWKEKRTTPAALVRGLIEEFFEGL